ncbi:serine hydrolase [Sporomusa malonica]|uniref:CubicO group peptidase, beta-lactamase class C family n=1 Tax=Sporomusa malonica TaxID=112901 RepID=A0A1W2DEY3_9FIRM|nr:serine hydrolase [Sporomusa malonica]SMC96055.1 CubicO group peptidase, beta-lactamase class C family [Sporomusa malonica]
MSFTSFSKHLPAVLAGTILALSFLTQPAQANQPESSPGCFALQPYKVPAKPTALDKKLLAAMEEYKVVGLSATVFRDNKIVWSGGYGWANLETERPVTPDTLFRVASLSKMVTATALMQLYDQGKFGLDDDISKYLGYQVRNPNYPTTKITFRQLLTHTSGILDCGAYDGIVAENPALLHDIDIKDILVPGGQYYQSATFANYPPGSQFSYSNFGTGIAGSLVEKISGMPFDKYCTKFIFKPLNMDASFEPADIKNWQNIAVLYRPDRQLANFRPTKDAYNGTKPEPTAITAPLGSALGRSPAGGLRSSTADFSKFMQAHMNGGAYKRTRILKADTSDLMHSMQWFGYSMDGFYKQKGLNFHITDDLVPSKRLVGHSGEAYGLSSDAYYDPDSKFGIVFMLNGAKLTDANPYYRVENAIAETLFDSFAPKNTNKHKQIKAKKNASFITVNQRKLFLPEPAVIAKSGKAQILFLPAISTADALSAEISQQGNQLTFTYGSNKAALTVGQTELFVNGATRPLPQAPYKQNGQIMVPVRELADALKMNVKIRL